MNQIRDILLEQRSKLSADLEPAQQRCLELEKELETRRIQIRNLQEAIRQIDAAMAAIKSEQARQSNPVRPTIIEAVLAVLERAPDGMTARQIMIEINTRNLLGEPLMRHSLSPQLSRLKNRDGRIELRGNRWFRLPDEPTLFVSKS